MNIEDRLKNLEKEITLIKQRNSRVETNKAWETSFSRKFFVLILTYLVIVTFMHFAQMPAPWANAVVPAVAFMISTLTIPFIKEYWIKE